MNLIFYEDMHLTDLRRYAKSIGVPNPCKYKRDELLEKIKRVEDGEDEPVFSNKGRPTKEFILPDTKDREFNGLKDNDADVILYSINETKKFLLQLENKVRQMKGFTKYDK